MSDTDLHEKITDILNLTIAGRRVVPHSLREGLADELMELVKQQQVEALWGLHEYMGQFPDDLNLAVMYGRIKEMEG